MSNRTLTEADIEAVADRVVSKLEALHSPIVSRAEAMNLAKCKSLWAWQQFTKRHKLKPIPGRTDAYSREKVQHAVNREAKR